MQNLSLKDIFRCVYLALFVGILYLFVLEKQIPEHPDVDSDFNCQVGSFFPLTQKELFHTQIILKIWKRTWNQAYQSWIRTVEMKDWRNETMDFRYNRHLAGKALDGLWRRVQFFNLGIRLFSLCKKKYILVLLIVSTSKQKYGSKRFWIWHSKTAVDGSRRFEWHGAGKVYKGLDLIHNSQSLNGAIDRKVKYMLVSFVFIKITVNMLTLR